MLYSIFNWANRRYDYYEGNGPSLGDVIPSGKNVKPGQVVNPECVAPVLPQGSKAVGFGCEPLGRIAVFKHDCPSSLAGIGINNTRALLLLGLVGGITLLYVVTR